MNVARPNEGVARSARAPREVLASLVVFLVALPLCMGIAIASGVPPALGLVTGIVGGLVVGSIAGAPLQVSGPAAGLVVLVWQIVEQWGIGALGVAVLAAGVMQLAWGALKLGRLFRAVSPALIQGMLAGIGLVIIASQLHVMMDAAPRGSGTENLLALPSALSDIVSGPLGNTAQLAALLGAITIAAMVAWGRFRPERLRAVPGALVGVVIAVVLALALGADVRTVGVPHNLIEALNVPSLGTFALLLDPSFLFATVGLAVIASAETLLCTTAVDRMHDGPRSNYDRELFAQGVGNLLCGIVGALPMTGVIVRSGANVEAGARTRASAILHGVWLLVFVTALPFVLAAIPTAVLAAVLVFTGAKLVAPAKIRELYAQGKLEVAIYATTALTILLVDLLSGVAIGFALSVLVLLGRIARARVLSAESQPGASLLRRLLAGLAPAGVHVDEHEGEAIVRMRGVASFLAIPRVAAALETVPVGNVRFVLGDLHYLDAGCREVLTDFARARSASGARVHLPIEERGIARPEVVPAPPAE